MCDGITQGREGMELSLLSRDVIAMSTSIGLSHGVYDGVLCLGICDKIVPGLLMGALTFGFLPTIFLPAGPMTSGIPNDHKAKVRKDFALGKISRKQLLDSEMQSYHGPGTCTFYGTANSNQMSWASLRSKETPSRSIPSQNRRLNPYGCSPLRGPRRNLWEVSRRANYCHHCPCRRLRLSRSRPVWPSVVRHA